MLILLLAGMLCSNIIIKNTYDKVDKSDLYWTYRKVLQAPFKYLKITGGNITHIAFEQSNTYSVRVLEDWARYHKGDITAVVKNDTLYVDFGFMPQNENEKIWLKNITPVRIFAPQLLFVEGFNTNFEMFKMKQTQYTVRMTGKSSFEVESMTPHLDSLNIAQQDSAAVVFEMSPEYAFGKTATKTEYVNQNDSTAIFSLKDHTLPNGIKSKEAMFIRAVTASVQGVSLFDVGHAQIGSLQLNIADSSGILLSGSALKKAH
jgi:hypothetical protein